MTDENDRLVLFDNTAETANREGTTVTAILAGWPDPRVSLIIDDHYCAGYGNPYWDDDDMTTQLVLSVKATEALARSLQVSLDGLLGAVQTLVAVDPSNAVVLLRSYCVQHNIPWYSRSGTAMDELSDTMSERGSAPPVPTVSAVFAAPGKDRDALVAALQADMRNEDGLCLAAKRLASLAHQRQVDKADRPYIGHPTRVAKLVKDAGGSEEAVAAAWLHDTVEDTWVSPDLLTLAGFPASVISAVDAVTKRTGESSDDYARRIAHDTIGVQVKRADLADNTSPDRLATLDPALSERLQAKYRAFTEALDAAIAA